MGCGLQLGSTRGTRSFQTCGMVERNVIQGQFNPSIWFKPGSPAKLWNITTFNFIFFPGSHFINEAVAFYNSPEILPPEGASRFRKLAVFLHTISWCCHGWQELA